MKTNNKGFSLGELIIVIAIMAILAAVAIPTFASFITKANVSSDVSFINDLEYSAKLAHAASGDEVSAIKVTVENGAVKYAEYAVSKKDGTLKGTVTITVADKKAKITPAANYSGFVIDENEAKTVVETIDWSYKFKSEKDGTWQLDDDKDYKELETTTLTVDPAEE